MIKRTRNCCFLKKNKQIHLLNKHDKESINSEKTKQKISQNKKILDNVAAQGFGLLQ